MAEQAAAEIGAPGDAVVAQIERQRQVKQDVVVVAGIERNPIERARSRHPAQDVEGTVAIERRDLDGDDIVDRSKTPPEIRAEDDAADRRLQIKPDQWNFARHRLAMGDHFMFGSRFHRRETEQSGMIADAACDPGLGDGLLRRADQPCDQRQRPLGPGCRGLRGQFQHRTVQPDIADRKLRGVDADREAAGAGVDVITGQRTLTRRVEGAIGIKCQRMRRDHGAVGNQPPHLGFHLAMMHGEHPYPYSGPATANGNSADSAVAPPNCIR